MLLNIILSNFQQYRTTLAKVIQFFVSPKKCENQRDKILTRDGRNADRLLILIPSLYDLNYYHA